MSQSVKLTDGSYIDSTGVWDNASQKTLDEALSIPLYDGGGAHNSIYRGKNLGSTVTTEQYAVIADGTFKDLYIGDYWVINNVTWRIAGFDYFLHGGDATKNTAHHCVMVPDVFLTNTKYAMVTSDTTEGGYISSAMYTTILPAQLDIIKNSFDDSHILTHRKSLSTTVTDGVITGSSWADVRIDLLSVGMLTGTTSLYTHVYGIRGYSQLPLFFFNPSLRVGYRSDSEARYSIWLSDIYDSTRYYVWTGYMVLGVYVANEANAYCRPYFCLC